MSIFDETWDRECPKCGEQVPYGEFPNHRPICKGVRPIRPMPPSKLEQAERLLRRLRGMANCYCPPEVLKEVDDFLNQS